METLCKLCGEEITLLQPSEAFMPGLDTGRVHSACVGKICAEILELMRKLPLRYRNLDPLVWGEEPEPDLYAEGGDE